MDILNFTKKYTSNLFKQDLLAAFAAAAWIFPLALALGANSPFGTLAGIIGGIVACLFGANKSNKILTPNLAIFLILFYAATELGIQSAMLSAILAGVLLILFSMFNINRKFPRISPIFIGAISFAVAIILCIIQVNFYFGIGVPQGHAIFTLAAYKSFGFHANWRGVLFGTITLVIMITYPIKFKKLSKKFPEAFVSLIITAILNFLLLNPDSTHTVIDEIGKVSTCFNSSISKILFTSIKTESILSVFIYAFAIFSVYLVEILAREKKPSDIRNSLILNGVNSVASTLLSGIPTSNTRRSNGATRLTNLYAAIFMVLFILAFYPFLSRVPTATLAVIIIVVGWKSPSYKSMRKVFCSPKYKIAKIIIMLLIIIVSVIWNIAYVICVLSAITFINGVIKGFINTRKS